MEIEDDLIRGESARALVQAEVERAMQAVSNPERVKAFLLLARPFTVEANEVTTTMKVRRAHVLSKYRDRLDALYAGRSGAGLEDSG